MKAIILAGGFARRLKPVTNNLPKCLLAVEEKTIIDHQIESLRENGVRDVVVVTGFKARFLEQHLKATQPESNLTFVENKKFLETGPAYGLWVAREHFDQDLIYLNGDLFCEKEVLKRLIEDKTPSLTALRRNDWDDEQVKVVSRNGKKVEKLGKKIEESESFGEFIGATKLSAEFLKVLKEVLDQYVKAEENNKFAADSLNDALQRGQEMSVLDVTDLKAMEIDTIEDLRRARKLFGKPTRSKVKTLSRLLAGYLIHFLAYLIPKKKNLWVFYGWHNNREREVFADNSKYFFLEASKDPQLEAIWIGRDEKICEVLSRKGYQALPDSSLRGVWKALRARYTIIDAFPTLESWRYSGGSRLIQLWHGKGMKKTGHDSSYSIKRYNRFLYPYLFSKYYRLLASSDYTAFLMSSTFREPMRKILIDGLPRTDVLLREIPGSEIDADPLLGMHLKRMKDLKSKKIILYAPTFRPDGSNPLDQIDFEKLNHFLEERNFHMILSLHPKFARKLYQIPDDHDHMKVIDAGFDIYPFLKHFDTFITDYSSLYVDLLLLDKPILFFTYDLEKYEREMGLHEDFAKLTPGPHLKSFDELLEAITQSDEYGKERAQVRAKLFQHSDGKASERILKRLKS